MVVADVRDFINSKEKENAIECKNLILSCQRNNMESRILRKRVLKPYKQYAILNRM